MPLLLASVPKVRKGRHAREAEDASFRTTLAEKMKSEDILLRVKRRLHAAEVLHFSFGLVLV